MELLTVVLQKRKRKIKMYDPNLKNTVSMIWVNACQMYLIEPN